MARLLIHVEGQTEEAFVNRVLRDYLIGRGYADVSARIVGKGRARGERGGIRRWPEVKKDILKHLRQDPGCVATTIVDFYGLPRGAKHAWPGRREAAQFQGARKAEAVEAALLADVGKELDPRRFVPFVVFHEFEALLFSDCAAFSMAIGRPELETPLQAIRDGFPTPEDINDSPKTASSKRVEALIPGYQKPIMGTLAALEIGLDAMRRECPHFGAWIARLESLAT
jgi:hypothetical protein